MKMFILWVVVVLSFRMQCIVAMSQYIQDDSQEVAEPVSASFIEDGVDSVLKNIFSAYEAYYFLYSEVYLKNSYTKNPEVLKMALSNLEIFFGELLFYCGKQGYHAISLSTFAIKKQEIHDSIDFFEARFNDQETMVAQIKLRSQSLQDTFHALSIIAERFNYSEMHQRVDALWSSTILLHEPQYEAKLKKIVSYYFTSKNRRTPQLNIQRARSNTWPFLSWLGDLG